MVNMQFKFKPKFLNGKYFKNFKVEFEIKNQTLSQFNYKFIIKNWNFLLNNQMVVKFF
jgi:hypothetical protein